MKMLQYCKIRNICMMYKDKFFFKYSRYKTYCAATNGCPEKISCRFLHPHEKVFTPLFLSSEVWGFIGNKIKILVFWLDTMQSGKWLSMFRRNMPPPYSGRSETVLFWVAGKPYKSVRFLRHRKYKRLKLGGGHVYDRSSVWTAVVAWATCKYE
jgi:hypothetical protein